MNQDPSIHFRISDILRLRRLQRMLPASAATGASSAAVAKDNNVGLIGGGASSVAMVPPPPPSSSSPAPPGGFQAGRPRLNGGGGRLLPMLHHQRLGLPILQGDKGWQQLELSLVVNSLCFPVALPFLTPNQGESGRECNNPIIANKS